MKLLNIFQICLLIPFLDIGLVAAKKAEQIISQAYLFLFLLGKSMNDFLYNQWIRPFLHPTLSKPTGDCSVA